MQDKVYNRKKNIYEKLSKKLAKELMNNPFNFINITAQRMRFTT
jgi:hypothetical protein